MTTPFTAYHKSRITYFKTLIKQLTHRIHHLKLARPTTKRARYINYQQIQARRNLLAHNYNCLHHHQDYLDLFSGC